MVKAKERLDKCHGLQHNIREIDCFDQLLLSSVRQKISSAMASNWNRYAL